MSEQGDIVDRANHQMEESTERAIAWQRTQAQRIEPGEPGECDLCGEWSGRLVRGACAPCRDKHKLY